MKIPIKNGSDRFYLNSRNDVSHPTPQWKVAMAAVWGAVHPSVKNSVRQYHI